VKCESGKVGNSCPCIKTKAVGGGGGGAKLLIHPAHGGRLMAPFAWQSIIYELTLTTCTAPPSPVAVATTSGERKKQHVSRAKRGWVQRGRGKIYSGNRILNAAWEFSPFMVAAEMGQLGGKRRKGTERDGTSGSERDGQIARSAVSYASVISLKSL